MKYIKLNELWEEDPCIRKIIMVNDGILKLLDVLTAKKGPLRLRSYKTGIELMAAVEANKKPEVFNSLPNRKAGNNEDIINALTESLEIKSCNLMTKKNIGLLYDFFLGLEIGIN